MFHLTCKKNHLFQFFFFLRKYAEIYSVVFIVGCFVTFFCSIKPSLIVRLNLSCQVIASPVNNSVHVNGSTMTNRARQAQRLEPLMGCRLLHERSDRSVARSWKGLCTAAVVAVGRRAGERDAAVSGVSASSDLYRWTISLVSDHPLLFQNTPTPTPPSNSASSSAHLRQAIAFATIFQKIPKKCS
jgi:hypothetical protein